MAMQTAGRGRRLSAAVGDYFGTDEPWIRPAPGRAGFVRDVVTAFGFLVVTLVGVEMVRGIGAMHGSERDPWKVHLVGGLLCVLLAWRRTFPLSVAVLTQVHMFVVGVTAPDIMSTFFVQVLYFVALYSGVAWARDRRLMVLVYGGIVLFMFSWLTYQYVVGRGMEDVLRELSRTPPDLGLWSPFTSYVVFGFLVNIIYFGGALVWGQSSWRNARQASVLAEQAATIRGQAADLRDHAVVEERLRIARELHDVVAHHVSVIGVQAAGARRVLTRDPDLAAQALTAVEESSRQAVGEMRGLLGTLRAAQPGDSPSADRTPDPGVDQIEALVRGVEQPGFTVDLDMAVDRPEALEQVPAALGVSMYRIVQEALANVRRHSTANHARVVVRIDVDPRDGRYAEVEVVDNGRPRGATSGTGLGLLGMRERIAGHGGSLEVGPRLHGGYRVRVRFPMPLLGEAEPHVRAGNGTGAVTGVPAGARRE